jgi:hypothetical protein
MPDTWSLLSLLLLVRCTQQDLDSLLSHLLLMHRTQPDLDSSGLFWPPQAHTRKFDELKRVRKILNLILCNAPEAGESYIGVTVPKKKEEEDKQG